MAKDDETQGSMVFKRKPEVLERPVKVELVTEKRIPIKLAEEVKKVGPKMADTIAGPLYAMLDLADKQGVQGLELQKMAKL